MPSPLSVQNIQSKISSFKSLLNRASTFYHLVFYNRKLINPYLLSSFGFKLQKSRQGQEEAKCVGCSVSFKLDPIFEIEGMQTKESIEHVLRNHQHTCLFARQHEKDLIFIDRENLCLYGPELYEEIYQTNLNQRQSCIEFIFKVLKIDEIFPNKFNQKLLHQFLKYFEANDKQIALLSIFGWKCFKKGQLQCQYCGTISQNQNFNILESHLSWCILIKQKYWQAILQKLFVSILEQNQGQFLKTEGHMRAKKLRDELDVMISKPLNILHNFGQKVLEIESELVNEEQQVEISALRNLGRFAVQVEQYLKNGIKQVKIQ